MHHGKAWGRFVRSAVCLLLRMELCSSAVVITTPLLPVDLQITLIYDYLHPIGVGPPGIIGGVNVLELFLLRGVARGSRRKCAFCLARCFSPITRYSGVVVGEGCDDIPAHTVMAIDQVVFNRSVPEFAHVLGSDPPFRR